MAFLEATDSHNKVPLMTDVSPQWAALVERWDELVETIREESVKGTSAPKTYKLMKAVLQ